MRRISLSFLLLLVCYWLPASPVGAERARSVAKTFLGIRPAGNHNRALSMKTQGADTEAPAYYVFNLEGGGFVIVSGDDAVTPILAYSRTGYFETEDMLENLASWMKGLETSILETRASGTPPSEKTLKQWKKLESGWYAPSATGEKVLETALWNQNEPYNRNCPVIYGQKAPTGCVATAGAIIMRYHQYPERGVGTLEGYDYSIMINGTDRSFHVDGHDLGHTYDWKNMPLTYKSGAYTQVQAKQVAQLMWDIGVMSHMGYGFGASSASIIELAQGMVRYMGYDASACYIQKDSYTDNEWINLLVNEIDNGRPILYSGYHSLGSGHAFVCDGYDKDGLLHFNWGGGGNSNGFFTLEDMNNWTLANEAYIYLEPNHGGRARIKNCGIMLTKTNSLNLVDGGMGPGTVLQAVVYSYCYTYFQGFISIGKYNKDGLLLQVISESKELLTDIGLSVLSASCQITIPSVFSPGEYMAPCYSVDGITWFPPDEMAASFPLGYIDRINPNDITSMLKDTSLSYSRSKRQIQVSAPVPISYYYKNPSGDLSELYREQQTIIIDDFLSGTYTIRIFYPGLSYILYINL